MPAKDRSTGSDDREIVTTRLLNAPRDLVFKMWTDPEHIVFFPSAEAREHVVKKYGAIEGARQTMDRLEQHLANNAS